jgi:hypothetical protein
MPFLGSGRTQGAAPTHRSLRYRCFFLDKYSVAAFYWKKIGEK